MPSASWYRDQIYSYRYKAGRSHQFICLSGKKLPAFGEDLVNLQAYPIDGFQISSLLSPTIQDSIQSASNITVMIIGNSSLNELSSPLLKSINDRKNIRIIFCSDDAIPIKHETIKFILDKADGRNIFHCHLFDSNNAKKRNINLLTAFEFNKLIRLNDNDMILYPDMDSIDFKYILSKALKYFGNIKEDAVEYQWLPSKQNGLSSLYNIYIIKLTINNGSVHPLNNLLCTKLIETFEKLEKLNYKQLRGYILTSNVESRKLKNKRPIFCAGLDLKLFVSKNVDLIVDYFVNLRKMAYMMHRLKRPIIAGINGDCIAGGVEFVIKCDYRIMYKSYFMQYNEAKNGIKLGSFPETLQRVITSEDKLSFIFQTSLPFYGYDAKEFGFVNQIIDIDPNNDHRDKGLINECLNVLENKYLYLANPATAAHIRSLLREKYINLTKNVDKDKLKASLAGSFLSKKFQKKADSVINSKSKL